jgi:hypothetical protein
MSNQVIDFVNPANLVWCRKKAGLDIPLLTNRLVGNQVLKRLKLGKQTKPSQRYAN